MKTTIYNLINTGTYNNKLDFPPLPNRPSRPLSRDNAEEQQAKYLRDLNEYREALLTAQLARDAYARETQRILAQFQQDLLEFHGLLGEDDEPNPFVAKMVDFVFHQEEDRSLFDAAKLFESILFFWPAHVRILNQRDMAWAERAAEQWSVLTEMLPQDCIERVVHPHNGYEDPETTFRTSLAKLTQRYQDLVASTPCSGTSKETP